MAGVLGLPCGDVSIAGSDISDNVILGINLHLGCTTEVSSFEVVIDRGNSGTDPLLDPGEASVLANGDAVTIELGRGANKPLLLTGELEEIEYIDEVEEYSFKNIVICRGRCDGLQLFSEKYDGDLKSDIGVGYLNYVRTAGDGSSMIAYLIDNHTSLSHIRVTDLITGTAAKTQKVVNVTDGSIFTVGDLVKIYDGSAWEYNKIASIATNALTMTSNLLYEYTVARTGTVGLDLIRATDTAYTKMEYIKTTIFEILEFIAETADLSGTIGYDFRVEYDGKFAFFPLKTLLESYSLQDEMHFNRYVKSAKRIKNEITVFGKADKPYPKDNDGQPYSDGLTELADCYKGSTVDDTSGTEGEEKVLYVTSTADFTEDDYIFIYDGAGHLEINQVDAISVGDNLTMVTNLTYEFEAGAQVFVYMGWGPVTASTVVSTESSIVHTGSKSVKVVGGSGGGWNSAVCKTIAGVDMDEYPTIRFFTEVDTSLSGFVRVWDGNYKQAYTVFNAVDADSEYHFVEVKGGSKLAEKWVLTDADIDWTTIWAVEIGFYGDLTYYIDQLHFWGKRWGGGSNDANVDGYAEDSSSRSTYRSREHAVYSDLLLSDADCEAKAQALKAYYKSERITLELMSETLDWTTYHPMAGNKVAADLDMLGVTGSTYRIDTIDIYFRASTNSIRVIYVLGKTPFRLADYLYRQGAEIRRGGRGYATAR